MSQDLTLKLNIRGAAAAPKIQQLQVQLNIDSTRAVSGPLEFSLLEVINNEVIRGKTSTSISVTSSGFSQNFNLGDFFDTPKTGAYRVTATFNGQSSNALSVKILL